MNVKQGDLAIVIHSTSGNEGVIVEVLYQHQDYPAYWRVRCTRKLKVSTGGMKMKCYAKDDWLRPVSGLPDADVTEREREHASQI